MNATMVPAVEVAALKDTTLLNMGIFALFVAVTMVIVFRASRNNKTAADYYAAGRSFTGSQNGTAIAGDYLSAASFLGITGAIAINGYDGFLYSIGFLVAWLVALLLVAELLRNTGKFTMADVLSFRLRQRPVRIAAALSTLAVCFFYLLAQMAGAGSLISLLLGISDWGGQALVIIVVGALMIMYVLIGGMKGTTWVQIIKAILLIAGAAVMTAMVLAIYGFNLSNLLGSAAEAANNPNILNPGLQYGKTETSKLDFMSLGLALVLGTAALPHVLMRFYTVPTAKEARKSVVWAIWLIGLFYLFTLVLGYGAAALVGAETIKSAPGGVNSAAPLLAFHLGGPLLLGFISAVAFATILAVVAGLTITAAASFAHDIYANVISKGKADATTEVKVARRTVVVIGVLAILGGIFANGQNVAFLVALAFAVAASANLPTIVYSLFWKKFTTQGAVWSMYGGLAAAILLITFSPVVSGAKTSMIPGANFAIFPLSNPGIVSIPLAFFLGWLGTVLDKRREDPAKQAEMEVRSLTGIGAEKAVNH
ncbi:MULTISPECIES: sodium/solute symporter [Paenarthrobacter]|jgi:cation/acetate symporter|uniref:Cation/acetate symporter n=1 Tax=Paenarthrobacter nicotinovorans TaxID=29320 RepID=A0ABT9TKZ2_PAENI|nr:MULTISPECIES: sodium/solute symporter [Paenarthrobacter]KIA74268.1 symporter YwcA [Arthrobacter sp. MWB30]SKB44829.1 cation/acetate symporter [Arthrobacter sp. 31Cvi3.1E]BCW10164.1 cation acetate symporter [Arthrobacter sp. NtRootA2]BCW14244.1 cation acetate symporter [Arthrobacter sp. NtRootA4]BCW22580.1 cation acetate symporter [Arthrobacter sp. NtRootC7]BCW26849.1 cation acetate symporter [Arthrobacter sp. NtRootC45]BCW31119.1 cation acetate symporter [Arthrobacter sp. NtRootD5]